MANFGGISFGSDQEMSRWNFENRMQISGLGLPALPWETGVFSQIFVPGQAPEGLRLPAIFPPGEPFAAVEPDEEEPAEVPASAIPVFARCVQTLSDQDYESSKSLMWTRALACWTGIIEGSRFESSVGKHVFEFLCMDDRKGATDIIRDACGIRSPKTALKRAQDLMQLIKFCEREKSNWWPLTERTVLRYIGWNEGNEKSKLIGKNLIAALKFFKFVMGADFNLEAVLSPLVTGRVSRIVGDREPRVQARPLTLEELQTLEKKVYDLPNVVDRYMVGCILYAVYARCRWSDLHSIHSIEFDVIDTKDGKFGFVEVRSRVHKTGGTEEKKALFMPFVAPVAGVTERPWALAWKEAMETLGFCLWRRPYGAICRAPSASGSFGVRPVTTSEITNMLNGFLGHKVGSPLRTTSNSMKDTLLAWSARYGIEENARTLLGHHSLQGNSMACYSRDLMTGPGPTRLLSAMILNIRLGNFLPDATRSGWMSSKQVPLEVIPIAWCWARGRSEWKWGWLAWTWIGSIHTKLSRSWWWESASQPKFTEVLRARGECHEGRGGWLRSGSWCGSRRYSCDKMVDKLGGLWGHRGHPTTIGRRSSWRRRHCVGRGISGCRRRSGGVSQLRWCSIESWWECNWWRRFPGRARFHWNFQHQAADRGWPVATQEDKSAASRGYPEVLDHWGDICGDVWSYWCKLPSPS